MIDVGRALSVNLSRCTAPPARARCCLVFFALFSLPCFLCLVFFASFSLPCLLLEGRVYLDSVAPALRGIKTN
jgi:hypothetical protein